MAVSTLPQVGPRPRRRLLGITVVLAVALVASLVLVLSFGGHTATRHVPLLTHAPAGPNTSPINPGPDNPLQCRVLSDCL
jgi:hypothetical protein